MDYLATHRLYRTTATIGSSSKGQQSSAVGESSTLPHALGSAGASVTAAAPSILTPHAPLLLTTQWSMPYDALALLRLLECCSLEQPPAAQLFAPISVGKHSVAGATQGVHNLVDVERAKEIIHQHVHAAIDLIVAASLVPIKP